jgi:hypothetical protein
MSEAGEEWLPQGMQRCRAGGTCQEEDEVHWATASHPRELLEKLGLVGREAGERAGDGGPESAGGRVQMRGRLLEKSGLVGREAGERADRPPERSHVALPHENIQHWNLVVTLLTRDLTCSHFTHLSGPGGLQEAISGYVSALLSDGKIDSDSAIDLLLTLNSLSRTPSHASAHFGR